MMIIIYNFNYDYNKGTILPEGDSYRYNKIEIVITKGTNPPRGRFLQVLKNKRKKTHKQHIHNNMNNNKTNT